MIGSEARRLLWEKLEGVHLTETEKRIVDFLADGVGHPIEEVRKVVDSQVCRGTLHDHISHIRKKIGHLRHDIICEFRNKQTRYRYILLVSSLGS